MAFNSDLVDDIARRRVAIFVGAGVSASATTASGGRFKQWRTFLEDVAAKIELDSLKAQAQRLIRENDNSLACELIRDALGRDKWEECLKAEFAQAADVSELHRAILALRQRITITTNFDKLFETAWQRCNPDASYWPQVISKIDKNVFRVFRDGADYIVKLHGTIDQPEELIFAKSEYNRKAFNDWAYRKFIETVLVTYTVVFVGFSMNDPAVSFVIEMYAQRLPDARPHYIFLNGEFPDRYIELMKNIRRLFIIPYSEKNNHGELAGLLIKLADEAASRRREILSGAWNSMNS